ncbi:MAG: 16S rRNA (guanine(966)-N(2))-methyltransferase RsmD [Planctomycetia bacterium]
MRIIAGEFRGRHIDAPDTILTRPMLDRVREALFGRLGERVEDARVLDLYAGSGSLGLEALSRGARRALFVERGRDALEALSRNIEVLELGHRARIVRCDALAPAMWAPPSKRGEDAWEGRFELVFMDPPYPLMEDPATRAKVLAAAQTLIDSHLEPGGILLLHVPERGREWIRIERAEREERVYGSSALLYFEAAGS